MLVAAQDHQTIIGGVSEVKAFNVEMNQMLFHSIINGIYADKIASPIRELCTNARDGHAAAGNLDEPFEVHLPSHFEPVFWVRDFGCSLTHEQVMGLYSTMFASSKRETNDAVGMIGLGSKSPFAYTSGFTITCWLDGEERVYSCFLGADGVPQIALLNTTKSDERNGVKVSFPVKQNDIRAFTNAGPRVFFGFDPAPRVLNESYVPAEPTVLYEGENFRVYDEKGFPLSGGLYAKQGCVIYPISADFRRDNLPSVSQYIRMVVDFPIGQLNVSTSREDLGYDQMTVANLKAGFEKAIAELADEVSKSIENEATYWDACEAWVKLEGDYQSTQRAIRALAAGRVQWQGQTLRTKFPLNMDTLATPGMYFEAGDYRLNATCPSLSFRVKTNDHTLTIRRMESLTVYAELKDCTLGTARMRTVLKAADREAGLLWLRPETPEALAAWREKHGNIEVVDLATVEPLRMPGAGGRGAKKTFRFRYFVASANFSDSNWRYHGPHPAQYEVVAPDETMLFVEQEEQRVRCDPNSSHMRDFGKLQSSLKDLVQAGVLAEGTRVYLITTANSKGVKKEAPKAKTFQEFIRAAIKAKGFDKLRVDDQTYELRKNTGLTEALIASKAPLFGDVQAFVDEYKDVPQNGPAVNEYLRRVLHHWFPACIINDADTRHEQRRKRLFQDFPLLDLIPRGYGSNNSEMLLVHYLTLELNNANKGN